MIGNDFIHIGCTIEHDEKYLRDLNNSVKQYRSKSRLDKEIDFSCPFAIEMPDLCFIPNSNDMPTFAVEIKAKSGLIPNWDYPFLRGVCKFCMSQHYKLKIGKWCGLLCQMYLIIYFKKPSTLDVFSQRCNSLSYFLKLSGQKNYLIN